jgi:glycosyltransferase involved in cell wall biosynthesis
MSARVLWLVKGLGSGGAERLTVLTVPRLDRERFTVEVAYLLADKRDHVTELERQGIDVFCLQARRSVSLNWMVRLRMLLRSGDYDLVHTHSPLPGAAARLVVEATTRLVHTEHNLWGAYRRPTRIANRLTYARNDAVIAVSDGVAGSIRAAQRSNRSAPVPETLLHGVDIEDVPSGADSRAAARHRLGVGPKTSVVGTVANLSAKKDHSTLLAAIDLVRHDRPEVVLLLVGDGPLRNALEIQVINRGLEGIVRFLGERDDVAALLPALDLFALSSRYEGLPIALLEAMAAGIACVSTEVGGIPEALRDGVEGRLVPPGDAVALAAAIAAVLDDPVARTRFAGAGEQRVRERFSIDHAVRRTEAIYGEVLAGARDVHPRDTEATAHQPGTGRRVR